LGFRTPLCAPAFACNQVLRVKTFYLITMLTDASPYSAAELADLYYQRRDVELFPREIKTTMGMDTLRCRTAAMMNKEILMHLIAQICNPATDVRCDQRGRASATANQFQIVCPGPAAVGAHVQQHRPE
jgi:hypothetical protein